MTPDISHRSGARHGERAGGRGASLGTGQPHRAARRPRPASADWAPLTALELLLESSEAHESSRRHAAETLSHELRTPLTTIYSGSKLLSRHSGQLTETLVREVSSAMATDAERLLRIVEDLVVAVALPGEPAIHGEPVLLQRVVPAMARATEARWPGTQIDIAMPERLPAVRADQVHLMQILRNLLDNAARYSGPEARIVVRGVANEQRVELHVLDSGPGVDPADAERVFNLFTRWGTSAHQGGVGLGLFVCRRLVELMGGQIWVAPRPGGGSDFAFDLMVYPADDR